MNSGPIDSGTGPDEVAGEQLRQVLTETAATVQPSEGSLGRVLVRAHHRTVWSWGTPVLAAAAAVLLVAGVGVYAGTRGDDGAQPGGPSVTSSTLPSVTSVSKSPSESAHSSPTTGTGPLHALPVYYAAQDNGQARLYREFHQVRTSTPAQAAIVQVLSVAPTDPDYESLWGTHTTLDSYQRSGSVAYVKVSNGPDRFPTAAFQQIVYTVTAADPAVHTVQISYGNVTQNPMARGASIETLAPVWLLTPVQGATASSPVTLSGTAMVFEAVVNWEVDAADGTPVQSGNAMTPEAFKMGPWSSTVTLPAGSYVAKAFEISAKDGLVTWLDSKAFTVR
jgi:Immunoglobulin-like domain of bacterial spore germination/Sporulation and spore germination